MKICIFGYWSQLLYLFLLDQCCIFKCFMSSTVFLGPCLFTSYLIKHSFSLLSYRVQLSQMASVLRGFFKVLRAESILWRAWTFCQLKSISGGCSQIPSSADPCL